MVSEVSDKNGQYNHDELHAPQWLNDEFFTKLLREKKQNKSIKISKTDISPGATKSGNFCSIMLRAKINYTTDDNRADQKISLIIKTEPVLDGQKKELLDEYTLFETEIKMYAETLPKMEKILTSYGDDTKLCANLIYYSVDPYKCLIFEDLCELDYRVINSRHASMDEVKMALLKLAKLHASSFKLAKEGNTSIKTFKEGMFRDRKILGFPLIPKAVKMIMEVLADEEDLAYFVPYFEKIEDKIIDKIISTFNAYHNGERDGIYVLNHGDFHMKNTMIREKGGKLEDLMVIDYQVSIFAPAVIDIMYAIVMLFSPDMRLHQRDELIFYYFTNFQKTLKLIEFQGKIPSLIDFQMEMLKHSHWELFLFISFIALNYIHADPNCDVDKAIFDEDFRKKILKRPEVLKEFREILPQMLFKGYFDF